jgi:YVTN family beta-propeller protein
VIVIMFVSTALLVPAGRPIYSAGPSTNLVVPATAHPLASSLSVSPTSGPVGTTVVASGSGLPVSSPVGFALAGIPVASTCATDASGNFPGTTGTPCTFAVPPSSRGAQPVEALGGGSNTLVATAAIGAGPNVCNGPGEANIAYDAGLGEMFVAAELSNNVSVINDSTNSVVATIPVGSSPCAVVYDPLSGDLFVANQASDNVSVISDATNAVVATVTVGKLPFFELYDGGTGDVYVANFNSANVSVISGSSNSLVATVPVGNDPIALAWASGAGEVFSMNFNSNNVTVINDTTNAVVANLAVGGGPFWATDAAPAGEMFVLNFWSYNVSVISEASDSVVANPAVGPRPVYAVYDSGRGEVFVENDASSNLSVINDTSNRVVANIGVGSAPGAAAYNQGDGLGEVFVVNSGSNNVSIVSDATNKVFHTVAVGSSPIAIAFDPVTQEMFVPNQGSNNVSVLRAVSSFVSTSFDVEPSLTLTPSRGPVGSIVSAVGALYDPNATITFTFAGGAVTTTCSTDAAGEFPGSTGTACSFTVPSALNGVASVVASDGVNNGSATFEVTPSLALSPTQGPGGTNVTATGSHFGPGATISFTFAGLAVASTCSADASGDFPGTTGTPCNFTVPTATKGPESVTASDGTNVSYAVFSVTSSLTITPGSGPIGTKITASGTGFAANSKISFSFAGTSAASTCSSDSAGAFPGTSGTACTFTVPASVGGPDAVVASEAGANSVIANVPTGSQPYPYNVVYDSGKGEIFVANYGSDNVTVINDTTDAVVANIAVGGAPYATAYDPANGDVYIANANSNNVSVIDDSTNTVIATVAIGSSAYQAVYDSGTNEIFVATYHSDNVSVISGATNTLVATVEVGSGPVAVGYEAASGEVFVANFNSNNVSVINDTNNSLVATVAVGSGAYAVTYDSGAGEMFVPNLYDNNVSVISGTSNTLVTTVDVGRDPGASTYDSGLGEIFVANGGSDNVSVISDATNAVVASIPVGTCPEEIAYDSGAGVGEVFVGNECTNNVSVISDSTNSVIATLAVGNDPVTVTYDAGQGEIWVANFGSNNVSVLLASGSFAEATFDVTTQLSLTPSTGSVDSGQAVGVSGNGFGSSLEISTFTLGSYALSCASATVGSCIDGVLTTGRDGTVDATFFAPAVTESDAYTVTLIDTAGNSGTATITVSPGPTVTVPSASLPSVDVGQSVTFSVQATLGSGSYTYDWHGLPGGCSGAAASVVCAPVGSGTFSITVRVTDSNGDSVTSAALDFTVDPDPEASTPSSSPGSGGVDGGQTANFTTSASFGTGHFTSYTWSGLPTGCGGDAAVVTCSGTDLPAGTYTVTVTVTDSNNFTSASSTPLLFEVDVDPTVSTPNASPGSADVGQSVTFSSTTIGGSGTYVFNWTGLPTGCVGSTSEVVACKLTVAGTYTVAMEATDQNSYSTTSESRTFTVYADPSVNLSANDVALDAGQTVLFSATATQGSGGFTYSWSGLPTGCGGTTATVTCTPSEAGRYSISVKAKDSNGAITASPTVGIAVAPMVSATLTATPTTPLPGTVVVFSSNGTGGTGGLSYAWSFGDGHTASGATVDHAYASAGTYNVTLWVNDTVGGSARQYVNLTVLSPVLPSSASGVPLLDLALVAVAIVAILAAAVLLLRGRRASGSGGDGAAPGEDYSESPASSGDDPPPTEESPELLGETS